MTFQLFNIILLVDWKVDIYYIMKKRLVVYEFGIITITGFSLCRTCTQGHIPVAVRSKA